MGPTKFKGLDGKTYFRCSGCGGVFDEDEEDDVDDCCLDPERDIKGDEPDDDCEGDIE